MLPRVLFDASGRFADLDFPANPAHIPGATPLPPNHASIGIDLAGNTDIASRFDDCGRMGVDIQLLLPQLTGWWSYLLDPVVGGSLAHSWNLALLSVMRRYPQRILGAALVPLQDVAAAVRELEWAAANGFHAALLDQTFPVAEHPFGTTLASHGELWPFFRRAEELAVPLFLHSVQHGHRLLNLPVFRPHGLYLCAPGEADLNLTSLITSGLLDDFPGLQFIHAETGTAHIRPLAERLDARFEGGQVDESSRDARPELFPPTLMQERNRRPPSHYFRNNFYWTIETEEPELADAIDFIGANRFLFATDYPHHDTGGQHKFRDAERLRAHAGISDGDKDLIRSGNAARLLRL